MDIETQAEEIRDLIEKRLNIKARSLSRATLKAGRLLPAWARREARYLAEAAELVHHPKMRSQVDHARALKAHRDLTTHLKSIDPDERRKTRLLGLLGSIGFNLLFVAVVVICVLVWRGFV